MSAFMALFGDGRLLRNILFDTGVKQAEEVLDLWGTLGVVTSQKLQSAARGDLNHLDKPPEEMTTTGPDNKKAA
jgi:hypothetical protein